MQDLGDPLLRVLSHQESPLCMTRGLADLQLSIFLQAFSQLEHWGKSRDGNSGCPNRFPSDQRCTTSELSSTIFGFEYQHSVLTEFTRRIVSSVISNEPMVL